MYTIVFITILLYYCILKWFRFRFRAIVRLPFWVILCVFGWFHDDFDWVRLILSDSEWSWVILDGFCVVLGGFMMISTGFG